MLATPHGSLRDQTAGLVTAALTVQVALLSLIHRSHVLLFLACLPNGLYKWNFLGQFLILKLFFDMVNLCEKRICRIMLPCQIKKNSTLMIYTVHSECLLYTVVRWCTTRSFCLSLHVNVMGPAILCTKQSKAKQPNLDAVCHFYTIYWDGM